MQTQQTPTPGVLGATMGPLAVVQSEVKSLAGKPKELVAELRKVIHRVDGDQLRLGALFTAVQDEKAFNGHPHLKAFMAAEHPTYSYNMATALIRVYRKLSKCNVGSDAFALGWTKLRQIEGYMTPENAPSLIADAASLTRTKLAAKYPNSPGSLDSSMPEKKRAVKRAEKKAARAVKAVTSATVHAFKVPGVNHQNVLREAFRAAREAGITQDDVQAVLTEVYAEVELAKAA